MPAADRVIWQIQGRANSSPQGIGAYTVDVIKLRPQGEDTFRHAAEIEIRSEHPVAIRTEGNFLILIFPCLFFLLFWSLVIGHWSFAAAPAAPPFTWPPDLGYDGETRSPAWAEAVYRKVASRIVLADGRFYHLDEPTRVARPAGSAWADHLLATAARAAEGQSVLCDLETGGQAIATLPLKLDVAAGALLLLTVNRPPSTVHWLAFPAERPITRAQFVGAIRAGLQLLYAQECARCRGTGHGSGDFPVPGTKGHVTAKRPCDQCHGTGRVPIASIRR